jgi:hypothetical protein
VGEHESVENPNYISSKVEHPDFPENVSAAGRKDRIPQASGKDRTTYDANIAILRHNRCISPSSVLLQLL